MKKNIMFFLKIIMIFGIILFLGACGVDTSLSSIEGATKEIVEDAINNVDDDEIDDKSSASNVSTILDEEAPLAKDASNLESSTQTNNEASFDSTISDCDSIISEVENANFVGLHGKLAVNGTDLVDTSGEKVRLKGVSTHGINYFPEYVNYDSFASLKDMGVNLVRLSMYTADYNGYCTGGDRQSLLNTIDTGVDVCSDLGLYCIIDWHILNDGNPNTYLNDAKDFFDNVSKKYSEQDNIIYEICNEPNGGTTWSDIKSYANEIIPIIRNNDSDAIILVGTPNWSQFLLDAANDPIEGYDNIMYTLHFYAATHKDDLRNTLKSAIDSGLPVFVSEFSICDASGNGAIDITSADAWFKLLDDYNISYAAWSLCNKNESASLLDSSCSKTSGYTDSDLSDTGKYIFEKISDDK